MGRGDHIWVWRWGYQHHGIELGDGTVVHYAGLADGLSSGPIALTSRIRFARDSKIQVREHRRRPFNRSEVCVRALSRLGEDRYNLVTNNCEHFATWCVTGRARSRQIRRGVQLAGVLIAPAILSFTRPLWVDAWSSRE